MNKKILGIGNAIVDVFAKADDEFLIKRNFIKGSMKLIDKSEFEDLKKNIKIEKVVAGGSVANTMSGIAYLKGSPSFIGKVNSDSFGEMYKRSLEDINVDFPYIQKKEN
jgi:sugar/nucleoside kinase (ribokinase family)